jgi:3-oxoacyl-[acyl-carrier-protein] synthase III
MEDSRPGSMIASLGQYRPERVMTSDEVGDRLGVSGDWIRSRTGIALRHVAEKDETVIDMAVAAAANALATGSIPAEEIDLVVVATSTAASTIPSTAAQVAARLCLPNPGAFDVNTACAGFCTALACADSLVSGGSARNALVVGVDKATAVLDWDDRDTAILFGDGAGAVVLARTESAQVGPVVWGSFGAGAAEKIEITPDRQVIRQDGKAVFRWAASLAPFARSTCEAAGVDPADLVAFVPHQANLRIIDALAHDLDLADVIVSHDVVEAGNTIAATIPMALARLAEQGLTPPGAPVLLFGFGAGLAYAGQVISL